MARAAALRHGLAEADHEGFAAWRNANPAHAEAVQRLEGSLGAVALPSVSDAHREAARRLLDAPRVAGARTTGPPRV